MNLSKHRRDMRKIVKAKIRELDSRSALIVGERTHEPARVINESRKEALYWWLAQVQDCNAVQMKEKAA